MKKLFTLLLACTLAGGAVKAGNDPVTSQPAPPPVNLSVSIVYLIGTCHRVLKIDTDGWNYQFNVRRAILPTLGPPLFVAFQYAYPPTNPPYGGWHSGPKTFYLPINSSFPMLYKVELKDITNPNPYVVTLPIPPAPCNYQTITTGPGPVTGGRIAAPDDPDEHLLTGMQVKWRLEEIDDATLEPVFTLEDPLNWASSNAPGASLAFNGFNANNVTASVAALQAGDIIQDAGIFDPDRIYRITRLYRFAEDQDWIEYAEYIGPNMEETFEEPWEEAWGEGIYDQDRSAAIAPETDLFAIAQDRDNKLVSFLTTTDSGTFAIVDAAGNRVGSIVLKKETFVYELNVAAFAKGMYVVQLQSGTQSGVKRFTVE